MFNSTGSIQMQVHQFTVLIESDINAYHAYVPALPGCHTFGDTVKETCESIQEAIALHIECMQQNGEPVPCEREPLFVTWLSVSLA
jgi:predicted RNase H-like HicB family nuclease